MTPKEKAKELVYKFDDTMEFSTPQRFAKKCALIAVNEIIELYEFHAISDPDNKRVMDTLNYFDEVKNEIEKL